MAQVTRTTLKDWFLTGMKPTKVQFWNVFDSFFHKDDSIPISNIADIENILLEKADAEALTNHKTDAAAHQGQFDAKVDKEAGKQLSEHDFTAAYKDLLDNPTAGADLLCVSKGFSLTMSTADIWHTASVSVAEHTIVNTQTGELLLSNIYANNDIPEFCTFPFDVKLVGISLVGLLTRGELVTLGVFSSERVSGDSTFVDTSINGQTLAEVTHQVAGVQRQGTFNYDSLNGVNEILISKGAGVKVAFKNTGQASAKEIILTLIFKKL